MPLQTVPEEKDEETRGRKRGRRRRWEKQTKKEREKSKQPQKKMLCRGPFCHPTPFFHQGDWQNVILVTKHVAVVTTRAACIPLCWLENKKKTTTTTTNICLMAYHRLLTNLLLFSCSVLRSFTMPSEAVPEEDVARRRRKKGRKNKEDEDHEEEEEEACWLGGITMGTQHIMYILYCSFTLFCAWSRLMQSQTVPDLWKI